MKLLTMREFFHSPALIKSLHPGQSLTVTSRGKPDVVVTKAGRRPNRTAAELRREAKALLFKPGRKVDTVALLRKLRQ
jgi:antitoxin (DNA-binding transcriptional repressor) of toxin-antitoxin stability system